MYKYRQVRCPKCRHVFVWLNEPTGTSYRTYRRKGFDEELYSTTCPKCNLEIAVPLDTLDGIDIDDTAIEIFATYRGI